MDYPCDKFNDCRPSYSRFDSTCGQTRVGSIHGLGHQIFRVGGSGPLSKMSNKYASGTCLI